MAEKQIVRPVQHFVGLLLDVGEFVVELVEPAKEPTKAHDCLAALGEIGGQSRAGSLCRRGK
jgi:hypothetical protein